MELSQRARSGMIAIQQGEASASIGEAIRDWYRLNTGNFERIDVDVQIVEDIFYVRPLRCKYASHPRVIELPVIERPLSSLWTTRVHFGEIKLSQLTHN